MYKIIIIANLIRIKTFSLIYTNPLNHTVINKHQYFEWNVSLYLAEKSHIYPSCSNFHHRPSIHLCPILTHECMKEIEDERKKGWWAICIIVVVRFYLPFDIKSKHGCTHTPAHPPPFPLYHRIVVRLQKTGPKAAAHQDFPSSNAPTWRTVEHPPCNSIWPKNPLPTTTTSEFRLWRLVWNTHSTACVILIVDSYPSLFTPHSILYLLLVKNRNTFPSLISRFWSTHTMAYLYRLCDYWNPHTGTHVTCPWYSSKLMIYPY